MGVHLRTSQTHKVILETVRVDRTGDHRRDSDGEGGHHRRRRLHLVGTPLQPMGIPWGEINIVRRRRTLAGIRGEK